MWGVVLALQSSRAVHLGVDNLGIVRHVSRLLDGCRGPKPFELVTMPPETNSKDFGVFRIN